MTMTAETKAYDTVRLYPGARTAPPMMLCRGTEERRASTVSVLYLRMLYFAGCRTSANSRIIRDFNQLVSGW